MKNFFLLGRGVTHFRSSLGFENTGGPVVGRVRASGPLPASSRVMIFVVIAKGAFEQAGYQTERLFGELTLRLDASCRRVCFCSPDDTIDQRHDVSLRASKMDWRVLHRKRSINPIL